MQNLDLIVAAAIALFALVLAGLTIPHILKARVRAMQNKAWKQTYFDYSTKTWINA